MQRIPALIQGLLILVLAAFTSLPAQAANPLFYATSFNSNGVYVINDDGTYSLYASGFNGAYGIARDPAGNLYVSERGLTAPFTLSGTTMKKVLPGDTVVPFVSGLNVPMSVKYGPGNLLY